MKLLCLLGLHDFFAQYPPLIMQATKEQSRFQYVTIKRICIHCGKKEEFIIRLSGSLGEWEVHRCEETAFSSPLRE